MQYWGNDTLSKLVSQLGRLVEMDMVTKLKEQPNFAMVKVRMVVGISLQEQVSYVDDNDRVIEQVVEYEWKPIICSKCSMFGHEECVCRTKPVVQQKWVPKQSAQTQEWQMVTKNGNKGKEVV